MTNYHWTVYCDDEVVDIATDAEVAELLKIFKNVVLRPTIGVALIVD